MPSTADTHGETSPATLPRALPEDCCTTNFHTLVGFVERTWEEFLSVAERDRLNAVLESTEPARCLDVRPLGRRGSIFRAGRLQYAEIADIAAAAATQLGARGLADVAPLGESGLPVVERARPRTDRVRGRSTRADGTLRPLVTQLALKRSEGRVERAARACRTTDANDS